MIVIADTKANSAAMLMPAQKMVMEMPASMSDKRMVTCSTDDVDGCLKAKGYKKTGSDTVDGHPCAVYELDDTQELQWRTVAKAIADLNFQGYFAHEFVPTKDPITSLRQAVELCTV